VRAAMHAMHAQQNRDRPGSDKMLHHQSVIYSSALSCAVTSTAYVPRLSCRRPLQCRARRLLMSRLERGGVG
jgi:hypothetical protein